jgi:hypothetical protein
MLIPPQRRLPDRKPFVLHLAYDLADYKQVRAHWAKNFLRRFSPDEPVHALMRRVLHQIRVDGYVVREHYVFPLDEVTSHSEEATREEQVYCALKQLNSISFPFEVPAQQTYHCLHLLDGSRKRRNGYNSTCVTVLFNPHLRDYLLNVAQLDELFPPA